MHSIKYIKLPSTFTIKFFKKSSVSLVLLENSYKKKKFLKIPVGISLKREASSDNVFALSSVYSKISAEYEQFLNTFNEIINSLKDPIVKKLTLRGTGMSVLLLTEPVKRLEMRLGLTHRILLDVPTSLQIYIVKKTIFVEGFDKTEIGNFVLKIRNFKPINAYTGKGFWLKKEKKTLKEMKKI